MSHSILTMSHARPIHTLAGDNNNNDNQQRFFAFNSQTQEPADPLDGPNNATGNNRESSVSPRYNDQSYPLVVANTFGLSSISVQNTLSTDSITNYHLTVPADPTSATVLVPTQPNTPSPTRLVPTQPNTPSPTGLVPTRSNKFVGLRRHPNFSANKDVGFTGIKVDVNPLGSKRGKEWEEFVHLARAENLFNSKATALAKYQGVCTLFVLWPHFH